MNKEQIYLKLLKHKKKTITYEELKSLLQIREHSEIASIVNEAIGYNLLCGVKASPKTYQLPQISQKYAIIKQVADNNQLIEDIKVRFYYAFKKDYYLRNPEEYQTNRDVIHALCDYFKEKKALLSIPLSCNERSFEIFGNEKLLLEKSTLDVLRNLGLSLSDSLNTYKTPEPFFYSKNPRSKGNNVLIIENKDTWYTMKNVIKDGYDVLGFDFRYLIYGEGRKILSSFDDVVHNETFKDVCSDLNYYYFGDIDYDGIDILDSLSNKYNWAHIVPFIPGYKYLISNQAKKRKKLHGEGRVAASGIKKDNLKGLFAGMSDAELELMKGVIVNNYILPQEMLNNSELRKGGKNER